MGLFRAENNLMFDIKVFSQNDIVALKRAFVWLRQLLTCQVAVQIPLNYAFE